MKRISLTDGSGKWFDRARATEYEEDTDWNGSNEISVATGSEWDHEALYLTASGSYILHSWSDRDDVSGSFEPVDGEFAYDWLIRNGYHDAVPSNELSNREV